MRETTPAAPGHRRSGFANPGPPLSLQHTFASHVSDIQAMIAQQDRMAEASEDLTASLMAQAFDGEL